MKRRTFIKAGVGVFATAGAMPAAWGMQHNGMQHGDMQHGDMPGMQHGAMQAADGSAGHAMAHEPSSLMPLDAMPSGQPLARLPSLKNTSKDAKTFKATLTAEPKKVTIAGRKQTELWLYNGELPGPQIVVNEGDTVEILFKNKLPQATTVHWHGLPVPADQDGNPQDIVLPGAERYYRFTLPEGCAGTYWFHPHPHGLVSEQVSKGLAGSFVVKSKNDPLAHLEEQHWMLSDLRLDADGSVSENTMMDWMNGREGQFIMINGQYKPQISVSNGQRIRIWNACAARYLKLAIPGCQWIVLGTDGGLLESPTPAQEDIMLAPAERLEVMLVASQPVQGELISVYYNREKMMVQEPADNIVLGQVKVALNSAVDLPQTLREIPDLGQPTAYKKVEFSEAEMSHGDGGMSMGMGMGGMSHDSGAMSHGSAGTSHDNAGMSHDNGGMNMNMGTGMMNMGAGMMDMMRSMFMINGKVYDMDRIDLESRVGEVEEWELFNNSHMDHPFHLHGTQFIVTSRELKGQRVNEPFKAWRDTVNLRPYETLRFKVVHHLPGLRMFHCHILEHEDLGMMANLMVK